MRALIWKELRENAKWGVLSALALGLIYGYSIFQSFKSFGDEVLPTLFTAPFVGLLLALLQILPELRRDQWAFLVHRPVSRTLIFQAKVFAGMLVYLPATLLPLGIALFWLATSRKVETPYDWHLVLAGLADTVAGILFYLAGILTAIRPVRWYGSRAVPLGAAVLGLFVMIVTREFFSALVVGVVFGVVMLLSALGSFRTQGNYQGQSLLSRFTLGIVLFSGYAVISLAVFTLLASFIISPQGYSSSTAPIRRHYEIGRMGQILKVTSKDGGIENMTDLSGNPLPVPTPNLYGTLPRTYVEQTRIRNAPPAIPSFRSPGRYYIRVNTVVDSDLQKQVTWYYYRRESLFIGYCHAESRWLGYLTPQGFVPYENREALNRAPRFNGDLLNGYSWPFIDDTLVFRDAVYSCDLERKQIKKLMEADPNDPIVWATSTTRYSLDNTLDEQAFVIVTKNRILGISAFSPTGKRLFTTPLAYRDKGYVPNSIVLTGKPARCYIWYTPPERLLRQNRNLPIYIDELERGKSTITHYTLPSLGLQNSGYPRPQELGNLGLLLGPALTCAIAPLSGASSAGLFPWSFASSLLAGCLCAIAAFLVGRRCVFPKAVQWGWTIGVLLLGPFGLLTLLSLRSWPARKLCPSCEKPRVVDRDHCEHCGAAWPEPARDGTEIFEEVQQQAA